ncbi:7098_t:CDS:2 [Paraglomus occultum]|uniref:7098_t:CDS:1 n=1 Tax=Paraglomus occultum TaxID=144539 RepID=A0A9N8ZMC9_9GLOM|nr:7098_t:CDS:2 [Paraglomus occultum]
MAKATTVITLDPSSLAIPSKMIESTTLVADYSVRTITAATRHTFAKSSQRPPPPPPPPLPPFMRIGEGQSAWRCPTKRISIHQIAFTETCMRLKSFDVGCARNQTKCQHTKRRNAHEPFQNVNSLSIPQHPYATHRLTSTTYHHHRRSIVSRQPFAVEGID